MAMENIRAKIAELRSHQQAIQAACATQNGDWRHEVVASRRSIGNVLGELSSAIASRPKVDGPDELRRTFSSLRAALAEHQALWPAVTIDPGSREYLASVMKLREAYQHLDDALVDLDRPIRPMTKDWSNTP